MSVIWNHQRRVNRVTFFLGILCLTLVMPSPLAMAGDCIHHIPAPDVAFRPDDGVVPAEETPSWRLPPTLSLDLSVDPGLRQNDLTRDSMLPMGSVTVDTQTGRATLHTGEGSQDLSPDCP
jgi:hypothetical protein